MLMPALSVTAIGLVVGLVLAVLGKRRLWRTLLICTLGAWAGFAIGAVPGVVIDVVLRDGIFVAIIGHLAALVAAGLAPVVTERVRKRATS
jgi:hypothetical protein